MYGVVTRNESKLSWSIFDRAMFEVMDVTGRAADPVPKSTSMISCFGNNRAAEEDPSLVPVSEDDKPATRELKYFDWDYICPNAGSYREELLDHIADTATVTENVRIDDVGFPRPEYCHCKRCVQAFAECDATNRWDWRASVITDFVAEVRDRVPGYLSMTLYPNPFPGHLRKRTGIDVDSIAPYVDEFVVPLYDMAYETTYWLEILAQGFEDRTRIPVSIELYAVNIDQENLVHAAEVADEYASSVLFAYDADVAREVVEKLRATE